MSLTKKSKFLSMILRHKPEEINLTLDQEGWADVSSLIAKSSGQFTKSILEEIVKTDNKGRYEFNEDKTKIRAVQGHSTDSVNLTFTELPNPPSIVYHGTSQKNYKKIIESGKIIPGSRHDVHLSSDLDTASMVGKRHGDLKIIKINTEQMIADGFKFFISNNGVILVKEVPCKYFVHDG